MSNSNDQQKEIVFICTGNTCRSPLAEVIFNDLAQNTDYYASSAGIAALTGDYAMMQAIDAAGELSLDLKNHRSRRINPQILEEAFLLITMTEAQKKRLAEIYPSCSEKIHAFGEFSGEDIEDPFGSSLDIYRLVAEKLSRGIKIFLNNLQENVDKG
ncbi:MAG: low molecular weight protein arginine phosphatase [Clostridiales bacterium]